MDHATLVDALKDPGFYPHPVEFVTYIQTHISSVFLTGDYAYKLKKPVDFGFLDFSTSDLRHRFCQAEVELNRRLAPDVYLRVDPITSSGGRLELNGRGETVDWLVVMRQMDTSRFGLDVLMRGELEDAHIDKLVDLLVPFYRDAATGQGVDGFGTVESVKFNTDENFAQTEAYVGRALSRRRFEMIGTSTDGFLEENRALFERRIAEGRIRESHGDLHLGNICFEDQPIIFDCIEFNDRFRCGDVAADLGFLAMDLDFRGRPDLAERLIGRYVELSGDRELPELIDFYRCYRAYVRGKIACFTFDDPAVEEAIRDEQEDLARRYFRLAARYAGETTRPVLLVVFGLMGTGKTSLARHLGQSHGWHMLSTDVVRKRLTGVGEDTRMWLPYDAGIYSPEISEKTYEEMCRLAAGLLQADLAVVIDGCFKNQVERLMVIETAEREGAEVVFLQATCEAEEQRRRLEERQRIDTRSDGRLEIMEAQHRDFEPPPESHADLFHILPTGTSTEEAIDNLHRFLRGRGMLDPAPDRS